MPVSGHEETGVKSFAGQFSSFIAGVPIKKRRFPLIQPSSPVSEEPCLLTEETTESQRKDNSSTSQGTALSNAAPIKKRRFPSLQASSSPLEEASPPEESDALRKEHSSTSQGSASSAGLSDTNENPVLEERKAPSDDTKANMAQKAESDDNKVNVVRNNSCILVPKLEEPNLPTQSCTLDIVNSIEKGKVLQNEGKDEKLESQMIKGNPELLLAAKEGLLALSIGADLSKQESHAVPESSSLFSGLNEHIFQAVASTEVDDSHPKIEKVEPVSLELSLSKEECTDDKSCSDIAQDRANWDLNTTMDAWEESGIDASTVKTGLKIIGSSLDERLLTLRKPLTDVASTKKPLEESPNKASMISSRLYGQKPLTGVDFVKKALEESQKKASMISSGLYERPYESVDPRNKCLSSYLQKNAEDASRFSVKLNPGSVIPAASKSNVVAGDSNTSSFRFVKPEPCDEVLKETSSDSFGVKKEFLSHSNVSDFSNMMLVDSMCIKSEPGHGGSQERSKAAESSADQLNKELPCSALPMPVELENCTVAVEVNVEKICHGASSSSEQFHGETVIPVVDNGTELSDPGSKNSSVLTKVDADNEGCRLKLMNDPPSDPRDSGEGCVNDEEKITLSEDDSYGSDFESDDNHAVTVGVVTEQHAEDDDYEDGEVREPMEPSTVEETICEVREVEHPSNYENQQGEKGAVSVVDHPSPSHVAENDSKTVMNNDGVDIQMLERPAKVVDKNVCVQESNSNIALDLLQREPLDVSERRHFSEIEESRPFSDQPIASHGVDTEEVIKTTDTPTQNDLNFSDMDMDIEGSENLDDAAKDVNGCNQGRIIDLSRAASSSSPSKTRPVPVMSFSSLAGRDVLPDTLDGENLHRGRDDVFIDGPHKFSRERHQDMSGGRNSRMNFVRGRGRMNNRIDSHRGEWDSDREYSGEFYNGPTQYRGPRPKYASGIADSDMEYNNVAHDGSYAGNGRLGRKSLNDGSYMAPRRRSPGGRRDGIQMGPRNPRIISPSRCMGGDSSEMVGVRHNEKFMRGYPDDNVNPGFTRPQQFEGMEGRFTRGGRSFNSIQRRGPPRIRSKSPIRSRSRSPGPWSSPRRRSPRRRSPPEGFGNHPDCSHRRSPMYRVDRMRSPDRPVFHGERVVRRHGSPSFMSRPSNDMRDIDSARNSRPMISNRSPSGRVLMRNRRFDVDPRDRANNDDDYFGEPIHSGGRILEVSNEANGEERRRFGERRGPMRSFRPPYSNNGENFHINSEDGPRQHYRFCPDNSDFHERGNNLREREFDRRIKGRGPGNVPPRRTGNLDEQEDNFRHGGQVWSDDNFDDISRVKRKRF